MEDTWASKACMCCAQWFDYIMRDRETQPLVCRRCAGDLPAKNAAFANTVWAPKPEAGW